MKVLLDHDVPKSLRDYLSGPFEVETAYYNGWHEYTDPALLQAAEGEFAVLLTLDKDFEDEDLTAPYEIGVVLLDVHPVIPDHLLKYETEMFFGIPMAAEGERLVIIEDQFEDRLIGAALGDGDVREELEQATSR